MDIIIENTDNINLAHSSNDFYDAVFSNLNAFTLSVFEEKNIELLYNKIIFNLDKIIEYDEFVLAFFDKKKEIIHADLVMSSKDILNKHSLPISLYPFAEEILTVKNSVNFTKEDGKLRKSVLSFSKKPLKIKSLIASPLMDKTTIYGFCLVQSETANIYNELDINIFSTFTKVVSKKLTELNKYKMIEKQNRNNRRLKKKLSKSIDKSNYITYTDSLTGLYNKKGLIIKMKEILSKVSPGKFNISIIDISRFHLFNQEFGYDNGDSYLQFIAKHIQSRINLKNTIITRYKNDSFIVVAYNTQNKIIYWYLKKFLKTVLSSHHALKESYEIELKIALGNIYFKNANELEFDNLDEFIENRIEELQRHLKKSKINQINLVNLRKENKIKDFKHG